MTRFEFIKKWRPLVKATEAQFREDLVSLIEHEHKKGPRKLPFSVRRGYWQEEEEDSNGQESDK